MRSPLSFRGQCPLSRPSSLRLAPMALATINLACEEHGRLAPRSARTWRRPSRATCSSLRYCLEAWMAGLPGSLPSDHVVCSVLPIHFEIDRDARQWSPFHRLHSARRAMRASAATANQADAQQQHAEPERRLRMARVVPWGAQSTSATAARSERRRARAALISAKRGRNRHQRYPEPGQVEVELNGAGRRHCDRPVRSERTWLHCAPQVCQFRR